MTSAKTDEAWERWGREDPFYGVITDPRFRRSNLNPAEIDYFFRTGELDVDRVMEAVHGHVFPVFAPRSVLDFGCGVGRTLFGFARRADEAVGIDVSQAMLDEAGRHRERLGLPHVLLLRGADTSALGPRQFDLVHCAIVLQHIPPEQGMGLFRELVGRVAPGGVGALQITYSRSSYGAAGGEPPKPAPPAAAEGRGARRAPLRAAARTSHDGTAAPARPDPEMPMYSYSLTQLFFALQTAGIPRLHTEFTDHGGELGVHLYFRRPAGA